MNASETATRLTLTRLSKTEPTTFCILPDKAERAALCTEFGLLNLRKLRFEGQLMREGPRDWRLDAKLGATAIQPCSVTLDPVTSRIDRVVRRLYLADYTAPVEPEAEMPEDDSMEPLPVSIDLMALMSEELALALPDFPRAEGAGLDTDTASAPGTQPLTDETSKPFAGLAALKKSLDD